MGSALTTSAVGVAGAGSLEVRWIFPGRLETAVSRWFERFPAETESREDGYLLDPDLSGLSVKVRAGRALEVKAYCGSPGILDVADRARGRMQSWLKWSFGLIPSQESGDPVCWMPVYKRRRTCRFSLAGGQIVAGVSGGPVCAVELTEIRTRGEFWWSLGFEATGRANLPRALEGTAALVFTPALPGGVELVTDNSKSYAEWLCQTPLSSTWPGFPRASSLWARTTSTPRNARCIASRSTGSGSTSTQ